MRITNDSRVNPMWQAALWRDPMWRSGPRSPAAKSHVTWREPTSWAATPRHVARFHVAKRREALCGETPHRVAKILTNHSDFWREATFGHFGAWPRYQRRAFGENESISKTKCSWVWVAAQPPLCCARPLWPWPWKVINSPLRSAACLVAMLA